jgi:tetratricopeptide (TPR) repeat protein
MRAVAIVLALGLAAGAVLGLAAGAALAVPPELPGDPQVRDGVRLLEDGRYELGLPLLEAALERLPGDPDILTYIAFAHRRAGRREQALAAYAQALERDPRHAAALAYQGGLFVEMGRRAEAEANLARLAAICAICTEYDTLSRELARGR